MSIVKLAAPTVFGVQPAAVRRTGPEIERRRDAELPAGGDTEARRRRVPGERLVDRDDDSRVDRDHVEVQQLALGERAREAQVERGLSGEINDLARQDLAV